MLPFVLILLLMCSVDVRLVTADRLNTQIKELLAQLQLERILEAVPESPVTVYTPDAYNYQYLHDLGVDVTERTSIIFSVQACNDAHVALSAVKGVDTDQTTEIVIGGWANSQSVIRACKQCHNEVTHSSSPLQCDAMVQFWVSWKDSDIRVGTGHSVGEDEFMSWHNPADYEINYVAVSTGWGSTGDWTFPPAVPESPVTIHTPNAYNYQYLHDLGVDVTERTSIIFSVQACNDAHVALSAVKGVDTDQTTEIVIGGWANSQSVIRACKQCHNEVTHSSSPLQCDAMVQFWVSWKDNDIRVGTGHSVGEDEFMSWHNPADYEINYVAVSTGWGSTGDWTFPPAVPESPVTIHTPNAYNYQYLHDLGVDVTERTSIIFSVQACNDAHVALSAVKGVDTDQTTEIVIGGWANSQSVIRACKQCHNEVTHSSSPLQCDAMVQFWVSWKDNDIRVGTGHSVGEDEFMLWHNPADYEINYVAVSTGWGSTGDWTFPPAVPESRVTIHTPNAYNYQYLHDLGVDVTERTSIIFSVQACNDAHVALSAVKGVDTDQTTEIVIGGWANSQSVIRACKQCHNEVTHSSSPLQCDAMVQFWVSWKDNNIRVGTGHSVGEDEFMSWHNPADYDINYVAVSTGWGSTGDWTFPPAVPESSVTIHTPDAYNYQYLHDLGVDVTERTSIIFSVQACNDAHVALSNMKAVDTDQTTEIVIGGWENSQSVIRACKQCYNEDTYSSSPLRCDAMVQFWVSWEDDVIRVGRGHWVGEDEFMSWHNPCNYDINYVAVSTGWGSTGDWIFPL